MTDQILKLNSLIKNVSSEIDVLIENYKVHLTHLDKILWPKKGITKKDLVIYYIGAADQILPEFLDRPITVFRCIKGVEGECFYQRHFDEKLSNFVKTIDIWTEDKKSNQQYICINNLATLLWLVNHEVIEIHTWLSKIDRINYPDRIVFDLDPHFDYFKCGRMNNNQISKVAMLLKFELHRRKLKSWIKTTGLGGLHVICPIVRNRTFKQTRIMAKEIAEKISAENPQLITTSYRQEDKKGKVLIDYSQNAISKSIVALGSPRADKEASISTKISWSDLKSDRFENQFLSINKFDGR